MITRRNLSVALRHPEVDLPGVARQPGSAVSVPLLADRYAGIPCRVERLVAMGEHDIVIGLVEALDHAQRKNRGPLVYADRRLWGMPRLNP